MAKKRLTNELRSAIKDAIIADIPTVDYDSVIRDYLNKQALAQLPAALRVKEFEAYLAEDYLRDLGVYVRNVKYVPTEEDKNFVRTQKSLWSAQNDNINTARRNLNALLCSFSHVEDIAERAPEFVKYLPTGQKPITNLPVVQLTQQLTALGWPKSDAGK